MLVNASKEMKAHEYHVGLTGTDGVDAPNGLDVPQWRC
jgi:hypothetical protein